MDEIITSIRENLAKVKKKFLKVQEEKKKYQNTLSSALANIIKQNREGSIVADDDNKVAPNQPPKINSFLQALMAKSEQIKKEREEQERLEAKETAEKEERARQNAMFDEGADSDNIDQEFDVEEEKS